MIRERSGFGLRDVDPVLHVLFSDIVDSVAAVRTRLGAGLYERIYERALARELSRRGRVVDVQIAFRAIDEGEDLGLAFRADMLVDGRVLVEIKAVDALHGRHAAQTLTYLRMSGMDGALLVNFNAVPLSDGIRRFMAARYRPPEAHASE